MKSSLAIVVSLLFLISPSTILAQETSPKKSSLQNQKDFREQYQKLVTEMVNLNSGSNHQDGIVRMAVLLMDELKKLGFTVQWDYPKRALKALRTPEKAPKKTIVLAGHLDTVFSKDHPFQEAQLLPPKHPETIRAGEFGPVLNGPGAIDMKGGLALILLLVQDMLADSHEIEWRIFIAADEETSSRYSRDDMTAFALGADLALVFEPGWYEEDDKTFKIPYANGGNLHVDWQVTGVEAHSGVNFLEGQSAITAIAQHVRAFNQITKPSDMIFANIAKIEGGSRLNVVPGSAKFRASIRYDEKSDEDGIEKQIDQISASYRAANPRVKIDVKKDYSWRPLVFAPQSIVKLFQETSRKMKQPVPEPEVTLTRSASYFLAAAGVPTLDSMGPIGKNYHSDQEVLWLGSAYPRFVLLKQFIRDFLKT